MTRGRARSVLGACLALTLTLAVGGCASQDASEAFAPAPDAAAWVETVRSAHAAADTAASASQPQLVVARLQAALDAQVPADVSPEHRRVVHQDLLFRIAQTQLGAGQPSEAFDAAERGLALGKQHDVFTTNLLIARGAALEALGRATKAASSYFEALEINRVLLRDALGAEPGDAGTPP